MAHRNILLVSPWSDNEGLWVRGDETSEVKNNFPPLGLATIAALTPDDRYRVIIWDELVHGRIDKDTDFGCAIDLAGITGYKTHFRRCREVSEIFRSKGILTAAGGPGVSGSPRDYEGHFDILFINEAELTWPRFIREWEEGRHHAEYRQIEKPGLEESPMPRWDSIASDMKSYAMGTVQTTRGCPFDCEFCDVVFLFGRRPRHKPVERVLSEVTTMRGYGFKSVFFCDDEFSGDRVYAKELLRGLVALNAGFDEPLTFSSQMSIAISNDEELLGLLADANFDLIFVGVESPNDESLKGANKVQNLRGDMVENIHRVLSYGIGIRAGIIVGFDDDAKDIFDRQYSFIQKSCLTSIGVNMLKAPLGTRLWSRLKREGRVVDMALNKGLGHSRSYTNIIPKKMTRVELLEGYRSLLERVYSWESFAQRVCGYIDLSAIRTAKALKRLSPEKEVALASGMIEVAGPEYRAAVDGVVKYALERAPHLLERVRTLVLQHAKYCQTINALLPQIDKQVERENSGGITLEPDRRAIPAPEGFRKAFDELLPGVYSQVSASLKDRSLVPGALTEVFVDFLVRWGQDFVRLEDYHTHYLTELSERTCSALNAGAGDFTPRPVMPVAEAAVEIRKTRLSDDIFKNIWVVLSDLKMMESAS